MIQTPAMSKIPEAGIYAIENTANGRIYVGSAVNLTNRLSAHQSSLNVGHAQNVILTRDIQQYGAEAFRFVILQRTADVTELEYLERMWTNRLGGLGADGYNAADVRKYVRNFNPTPEELAEFDELFTLVTSQYPDDYSAARALEAHGVKRPTGGARWTPSHVAMARAAVEDRRSGGSE